MPSDYWLRLFNTVASYYNTDTFSDVVVACNDQEFKVHGVILSAHSKFFAKALNGNWKVWQVFEVL